MDTPWDCGVVPRETLDRLRESDCRLRHPPATCDTTGLELLGRREGGIWGELVAGWLDRLDETIGWADHLDRPVSDYYREHVWITPSGMYSQNQLTFFLAEVGAERIIHSEDFPYVVRDNVSEFLEQPDLTDDERNAIAYQNAEKLMRI